MGINNETCSLLRPLLKSTNGGCISRTSLYSKIQCFDLEKVILSYKLTVFIKYVKSLSVTFDMVIFNLMNLAEFGIYVILLI